METRPWSMPNQVYDASLLIFMVETICGMCWYYKRRKLFPIAQRQPVLVLYESGLVILAAFFSCLASTNVFRDIFSWVTCGPILEMLTLTYNLLVIVAGTRIFLVIYWNFVTNTNMKLHALKRSATLKLTTFETVVLKLRKYLTLEFFILQALVLSVVGALISMNFVFSEKIMHISLYTAECDAFEVLVVSSNGFFTLIIIAINGVLFIWMYFSVNERLRLKQELSGIIFTGSWLTIFLAMQYFPSISKPLRDINLSRFLYSILSGQLYISFTVFRVILWSYGEQEKTRKSLAGIYLELTSEEKSRSRKAGKYEIIAEVERCLGDPVGRDLLVNFLQQEFAVENALFVIECQDFKSDFDGNMVKNQKEMFQAALRLYERFVPLNANLSINLPSQIADHLIQIFQPFVAVRPTRPHKSTLGTFMRSFKEKRSLLLDEINEDISVIELHDEKDSKMLPMIEISVFDEACKEIVKLLARDSFIRFKATPEYSKFVIELNEREEEGNSGGTVQIALNNISKTLTRLFTSNEAEDPVRSYHTVEKPSQREGSVKD
jgi:hypothetical protein